MVCMDGIVIGVTHGALPLLHAALNLIPIRTRHLSGLIFPLRLSRVNM
jgi:hypothetical protein